MKRIIVLMGLILFLGVSLCPAQEDITITTYYPSPYGVYKTLRLFPSTRPLTCQEGELYYDDGLDANPAGLYLCDGTPVWQPSGGGGHWVLDDINDFLYTQDVDLSEVWDIGIGTASPAVPLHIFRTETEPQIRLERNSSVDTNDSRWDIRTNAGAFVIRDGINNTWPFWLFKQAPNFTLMVRETGDVGIGSMSPSYKLDVTTSNGIRVVGAGAAGAAIVRLDDTGQSDPTGRWGIQSNNGRLNFVRATAVNWGAISEEMVIDNSGNVGIGTTSPSSPLHIFRAESEPGILIEQNSSVDSNDCRWNITTNSGMGCFDIRDDLNNTRPFSIWEGAPNFTLTLAANGNVGIGTLIANTKLAVAGLTGLGAGFEYIVRNTSGNDFYYRTSSARNKDNIQPFKEDFYKIFQAEPKSFTDKNSGFEGIGYIAEEFDELDLDNLVTFNKDGQPQDVKYELVSLYLLEIMKDQQRQINELRAQLSARQ